MTTNERKIGDIGEEIAEKFLRKHGYEILDKNYSKKSGEIDIIAKKNEEISFIEVKTTDKEKNFPIEQNVSFNKQKRLIRTAQTYLLDKKYAADIPWQIDVIIVELDYQKKLADIRHIKNAICEIF